jgi:hypothetical protein
MLLSTFERLRPQPLEPERKKASVLRRGKFLFPSIKERSVWFGSSLETRRFVLPAIFQPMTCEAGMPS